MGRGIPDLFLLGAPKAGTTALSQYLRSHGQVFFSDPKEPHFFNFDYSDRFVRSLHEYLDLFDRAPSNCTVLAEGSTRYLHSEVAVKEILKLKPDARFIVMLRNPLDMAPALHSQAVYDGYDDQLDFVKAWTLQGQRRRGRSIPKGCPEPKVLQYGEVCMLGEQVERLYEIADRKNVKVILFDDFASNPESAYRSVLSFLNLPPGGPIEFEKINVNQTYRSPALHKALYVLNDIKRRIGIQRGLGVYGIIRRINTRPGKRPALPSDLRAEIAQHFQTDIQRLSALLGRDLLHWWQDPNQGDKGNQ